uniref:Uncharacterized protein n=1 Tax=Rhizophora mucronata TaxID=61149 RepID=A0A2P2MEE7_RHIMU
MVSKEPSERLCRIVSPPSGDAALICPLDG